MKKYVFVEEYGEIYYEEGKDFYVIAPRGYLSVEQWKSFTAAILELLSQKKFAKSISDHRNMRLIDQDALSYLTDDFFPKAMKISLKRVASVMSRDAFMEITANKVYDEARKNDPAFWERQFSSMEDAERWLSDQGVK